MSKAKKKQNVILTDFKQSDDWEFKKTIEETTKEEWTGLGLTSNKNFRGGGTVPYPLYKVFLASVQDIY